MPEFKFEKLVVWQKSMDYGEFIYELSKLFSKDEVFNLTSHIRRAVDSVALNISEGSIGQSNLGQKKFIGYSLRSLAEVVTCLHKAKRRNYISETQFADSYSQAYELVNRLSAFRQAIK